MRLLLVTLAIVVPIFARPQETHPHPAQPHPAQQQQQQQPNAGNDGSASIVNQSEDVGGPDGTFSFSYETSNGIKIEENGSVRKGQQQAQGRALSDPNNPNQEEESGDVQVIQGSFSYIAPDGQPIMVRYIADENGFQPEGDHLPKAPAGLGGQAQPEGNNQYPQQGQGQQQQNPQSHEPVHPGVAQPTAQPLAAEPSPNPPQ